MTTVTAEQVRDAITASGATWFPLRECSICNVTVGYERVGDLICWVGQCDCSSRFSPERRTWQEIADLINMQYSEAARIYMAAKFGLKIGAES